MDFTRDRYVQLLRTLQQNGYRFITFSDYCSQKTLQSDKKNVILRHDVDDKADHALLMAQCEAKMGIAASYYFRVVPESNQPHIIRQITALGHEIGYHYEDMTICNGDAVQAQTHFAQQLAYFRQFYPVRTICMHGAPRSRFDGKDLWKTCSYSDFGIVGEPYFDTDFADVFYLTDTGRRWDGYKVSVRDKIPRFQDEWIRRGLVYRTTNDIMKAACNGTLPPHIMMTTHPQRWTNNRAEWCREWCVQHLKNSVKRLLIMCNAK
ncbi:MAG: hypothetical protein ACI392_05330 [Paludibacteraceae bacterium]